MKKLIAAVMLLTSVPSFATDFKVICAGYKGDLNENDIAGLISRSINAQIKELGERVIEVSAPQVSSAGLGNSVSVSSCVTVKLKYGMSPLD